MKNIFRRRNESRRFAQKIWLAGLLACFFSGSLFAQDLYDYAHSRTYARYLMRSGQFDLAAEELERLIFMQPDNDTLRADLLLVFRRGRSPERGLHKWAQWQSENHRPGRLLHTEFVRLLVSANRPAEARLLAQAPGLLDSLFARRTHLYSYMLEQNWPAADTALLRFPKTEKLPRRPEIQRLLADGLAYRSKKPWVAAGLSTAVPGLGRVYCGQWRDGLLSFVMVGLNGWRSYRQFKKDGVDSVWGWVHGGFALGFYVGNVYGAHKTARRVNARKKLAFERRTFDLIGDW